MNGFIASWAQMVGAFFEAPFALVSGKATAFSILPTVGIALFIVGAVLAVRRRERRALWLAVPAVLTLLTPIAIGLANALAGWFGFSFAVGIGAIGLLVWTGLLAHDAAHRLPLWIIGLSLLSFLAYCGLVAVALTWGIA